MLERRSWSAVACAVALSLTALACNVPEFEGPQVQAPPPAFTMNPSTYQDRRMFPDREVVHHDAWVEASWGNFSGIYINGHRGVLTREDVEAARVAAMAAPPGSFGHNGEIGDIETMTVDGRTAWGWGENWRLDNGGLEYVTFRLAVPYDTITYAIDFLNGDPGLKIRPDSLRTVLASFAVGETTFNLPLIAIGAGAGLLLLNLLRSRSRAQAQATRRMTLVKVPKPAPHQAKPAQDTVAGAIARKLDGQEPHGGD